MLVGVGLPAALLFVYPPEFFWLRFPPILKEQKQGNTKLEKVL